MNWGVPVLAGTCLDQFLKQFIFVQTDEHFVDIPAELAGDSAALIPTPLVFGTAKLYQATQVSKLETALELGSITFKTDLPYEDNPASLLTTDCYAELNTLGIVSSSVLDATIIALIELEMISKEIQLPLYQEHQSGLVWALKETREGSIVSEFVAYAVQLAGDENFRTYIESGIYDLGKMSLGAAFISLPKVLIARLEEKREQNKEKNRKEEAIEAALNVVDFRANPKLADKWKAK